ncbi:acyl-CoA transferase [Achromobacter xylosoxidans]|uniref:CoA transferase n=1 Tax=Alcaligenes xylosoxydans xylosoxydans TaxID=85698 RepID=A0A9X3R5R6_ALCXX|nr:CoA transferase [Achromobacter xylosoxidans]MCZ8403787.1 CoA transferase [Achromobacter xylosoxidans]OMG92069.1 acyl-CoA transferase [Achromobacter xylosoxidans]
MPALPDQPYAGLRVLDLSQGVAGPYCAMLLLDQGAEVIKAESPTGDWSRAIGYQTEGMSALSIAYNLGKRSICVNGQTEAGRDLLRQLALRADVIIESFRPGVIERLGLSYAALSKARPDQVYVSVSAFGPDGPYAERPGSDSTLQAMSGMMVVNRDARGTPRKVGILLIDVATGIYAAQATGAALYRRALRGQGSRVEVSLLEAAAAVQSGAIIDEALNAGRSVQALSVPAGTFETEDGHINVTSLHDRMFAGLCHAIGQNDWLADPRLSTATGRYAHCEEINSTLTRIFRAKPTAHWVERLNRHGVVCGKVSDYAGFLADAQVKQQRIFAMSEQGGPCRVPIARLPGTAAPGSQEKRSPRRGEHTRQILDELGLDAARQQELFNAGIVQS